MKKFARVFQFFDLIFLTCLGEYRTTWLTDSSGPKHARRFKFNVAFRSVFFTQFPKKIYLRVEIINKYAWVQLQMLLKNSL